MERIGPIWIDDYQMVTDSNVTKPFQITLERGGILTCVHVEYGDGNSDFFGNLESCRFNYPSLLPQDVHQVADIKNFACNHTYINRGNYQVGLGVLTGSFVSSRPDSRIESTRKNRVKMGQL